MSEGGGGEREKEEEEDEAVGCCSGYVLRNHQMMQWERRRLRIGPRWIRGGSAEHSVSLVDKI